MLIQYQAEPTVAKFHADDSFVRGLMGPIGSGKSVGCCVEIMSRALQQVPSPHDGMRYSRWAIIRQSYPELKSTTIKTWQEWFPPQICPIKYDTPIIGNLQLSNIGDGTGLDLEVLFLALDRPQDIKKLLSLELTGGWINEAKEMPRQVLDMLTGRVGRFPSKRMGGFNWTGVIMDTNPPDEDHWYYRLAEESRPRNYKFFKQPPAIIVQDGHYVPNPEAENVRNHTLGADYYLNQVPGKDPEWIKVYLMGQYGMVTDGKPVYPEYQDSAHCSEVELEPYKGLPILLGWDFGLTPAVVFAQITPKGELNVIDEIVSENMGIRQFIQDAVKPHIVAHYRGFNFESYGDPAGSQRAQSNETTCLQELKNAGIPTTPASTNDFTARRESTATLMNRMVDGRPAFKISPKCKTLRKALMGGYQFKRVQTSGERYRDQPDKGPFSHVAEALQYLTLSLERINMRQKRKNTKRPAQTGSPADSSGY